MTPTGGLVLAAALGAVATACLLIGGAVLLSRAIDNGIHDCWGGDR